MKVSLSLVFFLALGAAAPAEAQLGGLMRRAREAVKPPETPVTPAEAPKPAAPSTVSNPFSSPDIVLIDDAQVARFQKALSYETAQRQEVRNMMAAAEKRVAGYKECTQTAGTSEQAMKIIQDWSDKIANMPTDEGAKAVPQMYGEVAAYVAKQCGEDPEQVARIRDERMRAIEGEASNIAMPPGWTPPSPQRAQAPAPFEAETMLAVGQRAHGPMAAAPAAPSAVQAPTPYLFLRPYAMLKERIPVFCGATSAPPPTSINTDAGPMTVVQIPGQGGQAYAYREQEVSALSRGCVSIMNLLTPLLALALQ
jgi:hypothetical protein